jgi:hypothetical protein
MRHAIPLSDVRKWTSSELGEVSAYDPKRTFGQVLRAAHINALPEFERAGRAGLALMRCYDAENRGRN